MFEGFIKAIIISEREIWGGEFNFPDGVSLFKDLPSITHDGKVWRERRISFNEEVPYTLTCTIVTLFWLIDEIRFCWNRSLIEYTEDGYRIATLWEVD